MILGSIPGISVGAHANTSRLSDKNFLSKVLFGDAVSNQFGGLALDDVDYKKRLGFLLGFIVWVSRLYG